MKKFFILLMLSFLFTSPCLKAMIESDGATVGTALIAKKKEEEKTKTNFFSQKSKEEVTRDLIFLDSELPKDSLNFLATKFPKLLKECKQPPKEENNYESSLIPKERGGKSPQEWFIEAGKLLLKKSPNFFPSTEQEKKMKKKS